VAKGLVKTGGHDKLHVTFQRIVMASASTPKPLRVKVREHRERLRAQGLRPIQVWVPDVRSPSFRSEAHRQSAAIAASAHAREDQAFIDAVSDWGDE
jgi:antidote-toxin recognition MazE-like antitoxin